MNRRQLFRWGGMLTVVAATPAALRRTEDPEKTESVTSSVDAKIMAEAARLLPPGHYVVYDWTLRDEAKYLEWPEDHGWPSFSKVYGFKS